MMKNGRVVINRNICDNAPECGGIEICPTGALFWDEENEQIGYDDEKCIDCGSCADPACGCPVGAILWGETQEDYEKILKQVDSETMTLNELNVERYGAMPMSTVMTAAEFEEVFLSNQELLLVEVFSESSINCLVKSIPINDILESLDKNLKYIKVEVDAIEDFKICNISETPSLLLIKGKEIIKSVSGYYTLERKEELINLIK